jgi:hypothetical protein
MVWLNAESMSAGRWVWFLPERRVACSGLLLRCEAGSEVRLDDAAVNSLKEALADHVQPSAFGDLFAF